MHGTSIICAPLRNKYLYGCMQCFVLKNNSDNGHISYNIIICCSNLANCKFTRSSKVMVAIVVNAKLVISNQYSPKPTKAPCNKLTGPPTRVVPQDHLCHHKWSPWPSCMRYKWSPAAISSPPYQTHACKPLHLRARWTSRLVN